MTAERLMERGRSASQLASETARYVVDEPTSRGGSELALLFLDFRDLLGAALLTLERGSVRPSIWRAVDDLLEELVRASRMIGNDGQLTRFAVCADALRSDWADFETRLSEQDRQADRTPRPDTREPAPEDPRLTEALRETFPASDPIAPT
jgi:hypothetical protein